MNITDHQLRLSSHAEKLTKYSNLSNSKHFFTAAKIDVKIIRMHGLPEIMHYLEIRAKGVVGIL